MGVDASAVARVLGITTQFKDLRGGVLFLPQRIMVVAQGQTGVSYASTKYQATSAGQVAARFGFKSALHLIARELHPANGDGVGTIPVTYYPLSDHGSGVAAAGDITPSGTATAGASYRVRVAGYLSDSFVIAKDAAMATAATLTATCTAIGDAIEAIPFMPVNVTYTYGTVTASALSGTGNGTITSLSVTGNPRPGVWNLKVNTVVANGGVWTLTDPKGTVVSTTVTMTPGAGGATVINVGGLQFTLTDSTTDFGLNAFFNITVPATDVTLTCAWKGETGNDIVVEVIGDSAGITFAITQPTGGLTNPDVQTALDQVGNVWETMVVNGLNIADTTALDKYATWGEGRWGTLVYKPLACVMTGNTEPDRATATVVPDARPTDRVNSMMPAPGSVNLPFVVAARAISRIAKVANDNPPTDYGAEILTGIIPGTDAQQWDAIARDVAVKDGSSTTEVEDSVVKIGDVVTFWKPTGEEPPAFRYVCDIVKLQNIIFNLWLIFAAKEWAAAPLIPDNQATVNAKARKPKSAKTAVNNMLDSLALQAIISDPATAKKKTTAVIDSMNPKRLNVSATVQLSGNTNVKDVQLNFGFFYGQALLAA